jgi:hypothetical protein
VDEEEALLDEKEEKFENFEKVRRTGIAAQYSVDKCWMGGKHKAMMVPMCLEAELRLSLPNPISKKKPLSSIPKPTLNKMVSFPSTSNSRAK